MVINRIHLGSVVFARTLAASIAARRSAPARVGDRNTTTTRETNRRQLPHAPGGRPIRSTAETT
jgi:hypothetical protein